MKTVNPAPGFWSGKRVLLTGHTGFKGAWLALWLQSLGAKICGYSLAPLDERNLFDASRAASRMDHMLGDIRDLQNLSRVIDAFRPEIVMHLAAQALVRESYRTPVDTFATNVMGTVNVLEAVRSVPEVRAVVVVTSDKCYANDESGRHFRETDMLGGKDPYSASKACAEIVAGAMRASFFSTGAAIATVRAGNVIGGGDWSADRLIPDCVRAFEQGRVVEIRSPQAVRPWQHVLEPLAGYLRVAEGLCNEPVRIARAWNFGPVDAGHRDVGYVVERAATLWGERAGSILNRADAQSFPEAGCLKLDARDAADVLNWHPRLSLDDSIDWTMSWYRQAHAGMDARTLSLAQIERYTALGNT